MDKFKIKEGLTEYRLRNHLSLREMAERLSMTEEVYAQYESEHPPTPDVDTLCRMAQAVNKSVDYLLLGKETVEARALKKLPEDFQILCDLYLHMNLQNTEKFQFMCRFLKFLREEQEKNEQKPSDS